MRVAIYARVSTEKQETAMQLAQLHKYVEARTWTIAAEYIDEGVSSAKRRPQLERMMSDAHKRQFDVVLVWAYDRMARSTIELLMALEKLRSLGVSFVSYQQNIDTTTPAGELFFTIIAGFAQFERSMIRARVKAGLDNARDKGVKLGPKTRYAPAVYLPQIVAAKQAGQSSRAIAKELGMSYETVNRMLRGPESVELIVPG